MLTVSYVCDVFRIVDSWTRGIGWLLRAKDIERARVKWGYAVGRA
jgi:hypothetical protein